MEEFYALAGRYGCSGICTGHWPGQGEKRRLYHAPSAGGKSGTQGGEAGAEDEGLGQDSILYLYLFDGFERNLSADWAYAVI